MGKGFKETLEVVDVTPALAAKWLERTTLTNRRVSRSWVQALANEMEHGNWKLTNQAIGICPHGVFDGQHRLAAVVASGRTIRTAVMYTKDESIIEAVDRGRRRSVADDLKIAGITNGSLRVSIANALRHIETGYTTKHNIFRAEHYHRYHDKYRAGFDFVMSSWTRVSRLRRMASLAAPYVYLFDADPGVVSGSYQAFGTGEGLFSGDPEYTLACWCDARKAAGKPMTGRVLADACLAALLARLEGRKLYKMPSGYKKVLERAWSMRAKADAAMLKTKKKTAA